MILGISLVAHRVAADDVRVRYEWRGRSVIPEELVLRRWKARSSTPAARQRGEVSDGCRLHPHIWSTLSACLAAGLRLDATLSAEMLRHAMEGVKARGKWCRERVSKTQQQELAFLKGLGLSARPVYVREVSR